MSVDELDLRLLEELEKDSRQSVQTLAKRLGVNRTTAGYRLNRLTERGILTIACIANTDLLGYQIILTVGMTASPGKAEAVADKLLPLPEVKVVSLTGGRYGIMAWILLRDRPALVRLVCETLAEIPDIASIDIMYSIKWVKDSWTYFNPQLAITDRRPMEQPGAIDLSIIKAMQRDPRQTAAQLARNLGCGTSAVKARLDSLLCGGFIRFVSIIDSAKLGYDIGVIILVKSRPDRVSAVAETVSMQKSARHVSLIAGPWQILVAAVFQNTEHMHHYLASKLTAIPGVLEFDVIHLVKTLKFLMRFLE